MACRACATRCVDTVGPCLAAAGLRLRLEPVIRHGAALDSELTRPPVTAVSSALALGLAMTRPVFQQFRRSDWLVGASLPAGDVARIPFQWCPQNEYCFASFRPSSPPARRQASREPCTKPGTIQPTTMHAVKSARAHKNNNHSHFRRPPYDNHEAPSSPCVFLSKAK